jgi:ankyrin repeat protein
MFDCTLRIAKIIGRRAVEDVQTQPRSPLEPKDLKDLRQSLQFSYIDLYSKLLFAITKLVVKLDSRWLRWVDNVFGLSDWEAVNQSLKDAEGECIEDLEAIHRYKSDSGAQESPFKNKGRNLLHQAAAMDFPDKVFEYVEFGNFDVNAKTSKGWTALSLAAECGYFKVVKILTGVRGVDLNSQNNDGRTALHVASLKNRKGTVKYLTEKGAKVDVKDINGRTAFLDAARDGFTEIVKSLKEKGADINQVTAKHGWSALHMAAWNDRPETTKYLISAGIDKNVKVKSGASAGKTARDMAEECKHAQVLEFMT